MNSVLDASALIALLRGEPGSDTVDAAVAAGAMISAVNYSEVIKKTVERGGAPERAASFIRSLKIAVVAFDEEQAVQTARFYPETKEHGMSFADRACLALGLVRDAPVITAERKMDVLGLPVRVRVIRHG